MLLPFSSRNSVPPVAIAPPSQSSLSSSFRGVGNERRRDGDRDRERERDLDPGTAVGPLGRDSDRESERDREREWDREQEIPANDKSDAIQPLPVKRDVSYAHASLGHTLMQA